MKVLHVIPSLSARHGGPSQALPVMARSLVAAGVEVDVVTTDDDGPGNRLSVIEYGVWLTQEGWRVMYFPRQVEFYKVSWSLGRWLLAHVREYDAIHIHAVFSFTTLAAGWAANLSSVPFIVRPLGTLNAWGMKHRRPWLKSLSFKLLDRPVLDRASAMHYTSEQELSEAAPLQIHSRPVVLPLGFELHLKSVGRNQSSLSSQWPQASDREVILFLSRLHEKKGLDVLLRAFAALHQQNPRVLLLIAGEGDAGYVLELKSLAESLKISSQVIWAGHVEGSKKMAALSGARLFVLPSHSENFGIALLEAMAAGLPCITTDGVALACEPACAEAVVRIPVDDSLALTSAMQSLLQNAAECERLGSAARSVSATYSASVMAQRLEQLYREVAIHESR